MKYNTIDKNDINIVKPSYNGSKKNSKPELESEPLESNQNDEVKIEWFALINFVSF